MTVLAEMMAGLGLLFMGLAAMSTHLQQATGRKVRVLLHAATRSPVAGLVCGAVAGAATQSSNAVAVISGNLVRSGALSARDAIPVVAGGNLGTALLVFIAAIDLRLVVLYLVALAGFAVHFRLDRRPAWRDWVGVVLGLALVLLGLDFIKSAPRHMELTALAPWLATGLTPVVAFAAGLAAAGVSQSSSTSAILVLALAQIGIIGLDDAFYIVLGANLGAGLSTLVASGGLEGTGRQLCYVHILVKAIGCLVLFLAWEGARLAGIDPATALLAAGHHDIAASVSFLFLALQLAGALPVALARKATERLAVALSPPTAEDHASRPRFVHEQGLGEPATALDLSQKETERLIRRLPRLLPDLDPAPGTREEDRTALWRGSAAVARAIDHFIVALIERRLPREELHVALQQQAQLEMVRALQDALHEFSDVVEAFPRTPPLAFNLSESLRTIVLSLVDALDGAPQDFEILAELTSDRSELLNRLRRNLVSGAAHGEEEARGLLHATSLFERALWLVRRIAVALRPSGNEAKRDKALAEGA